MSFSNGNYKQKVNIYLFNSDFLTTFAFEKITK